MSRYRVSTCGAEWDTLAPDFFTNEDPRPYFGEVFNICALKVRYYYRVQDEKIKYLVVCDTHSEEFKDAVKHQTYFN